MSRDDKGRALYRALNSDTFAVAWDDLADHRRERYRIAAEAFDAVLDRHRVGIAE